MEIMRTISLIALMLAFTAVCFGQSLRSTPQKMNVPELPSQLTEPSWETAEQIPEDLNVDMLFEKMNEIERTIFNQTEFNAIVPEDTYLEESISFF
jgi:hypothetical protein